MKEFSDMIDNLEESTVRLTEIEPVREEKMFTAKDIPEIVRIFKEADVDGSGALDMEEFSVAMEQFYGYVSKEELEVLHMQIDANCDGTVDIGELLNFLIDRQTASEFLDLKNQPFPLPLQVTPVNHRKAIVHLLFRPYEDDKPKQDSEVSREENRPYQRGQYLSISSDGVFNYWSDSFDNSTPIPLHKSPENGLYKHTKKMHITDMVYLEDLKHVAISTTDRELLFYMCGPIPELFNSSFSLIVDDTIVNALHYWYQDDRRMFSFGDTQGDFYVFVTKYMGNSLFCSHDTHNFPTVYVADLIKMSNDTEACIKLNVINDMCTEITYFPSLQSYAICGSSHRSMAIVAIPESPEKLVKTKSISKKIKLFKSWGDHQFFTCVEYSASAECFVTGGTDGFIRVWSRHNSRSWKRTLKEHSKAITHLMFNRRERLLLSLSEEKKVCVWSEDGWVCRQSFQIEGMKPAPISSVCYNKLNNELIIANSDIGTFLGRGTDLFKKMLTSHDKPLCAALYHSIFKQVISVCQKGVVTVWDILTGNAIMQFNVSPDQLMGHTAISFDEEKRRLVTISTDGRVKLWNFNTGMELSVLPVTLANEVTAVVHLKNRMFVSIKNSRIIYDLDMVENEHRYLKHHHLNDVTSLDVNVLENTLTAASSNGYVVIWDISTYKTLYHFNTSKSPQTDKQLQGESGILAPDRKRTTIKDSPSLSTPGEKSTTRRRKSLCTSPLIKYLKKRESSVCTARLLTSSDTFICAWSVKSKGAGLLVKFRAVSAEGAVVTTMSTDASEKILFTGDSTGSICLWDIKEFVSQNPPPVLCSWQAHCAGIVSITCDPNFQNIITAGLDKNIRLWTNKGQYIGMFGSDQWEASSLCPVQYNDQREKVERKIETSKPEEPTFHSSFNPDPSKAFIQTVSELFERYPNFYRLVKNYERDNEGTGSHLNESEAQQSVHTLSSKHLRNDCEFREKGPLKGPPYLKWSRSNNGQLVLKRVRPPPCPQPKFVHAAIHKNEPKPVPPPPKHQESLAKTLKQGFKTTDSQPLVSVQVQLTQDQTQTQLPQTPLTNVFTTNSLSCMQRSAGTAERKPEQRVPPESEKAQLTDGQTQVKTKPLQTLHTTDCTEALKSSSHLQSSVSAQRQSTKHVRLPPIGEKGQKTPEPLVLLRSDSTAKQRSQQTQNLLGFSPKPEERTTFLIEALKRLPYKQESAGTAEEVDDKRMLRRAQKWKKTEHAESQTQLEAQAQRPAIVIKQESQCNSKHLLLPPIPGKVQLTGGQAQSKPKPPRTPPTTSNSLSRTLTSASSQPGQGTLGVPQKLESVHLPRGQAQLKPQPPPTYRLSSVRQGSDQRILHQRTPAATEKNELPHRQTQENAQGSRTPSPTQSSVSALKQGTRQKTKRGHFPPKP